MQNSKTDVKADFMKIVNMLVDCGTGKVMMMILMIACYLSTYFDLVEILVPYASRWRIDWNSFEIRTP